MERNRINITFYGNSLKLLEYYLGDNVKKHSFMNNFVVTAAFVLFDCLKLNEEEINVLANIIKSSDEMNMKIVKKYAKILLKQILSKKKEKRKEERRRRKRKKVSEVKSITVERKETITVTSSISSTSNVENIVQVSNSENENLPDFMKDNPWINIIRSRTRNQ